jgi:hypothetical protein
MCTLNAGSMDHYLKTPDIFGLRLPVTCRDSDSMVVKFAGLACEERNGTPYFFTSFRVARADYSPGSSPLCNMSPSLRGIATVHSCPPAMRQVVLMQQGSGPGLARVTVVFGLLLPEQRQGMRYR